MIQRFYFLCLLLLSTAALFAQEPRKLIRGYNLQTENDVFAGLLGFKNEDKDYSGGFKFEFYTDRLKNGIFPFFKNRKELRKEDDYFNFNSIYLQGMGFTPNREAFAASTPVRDQRPYASVFGIGRRRVAVFEPSDISVESDLFIGKVGTKIPGQFQNFLHGYVTNSDKVQGWNNQIANGGRWVANYRVRANINLLRLVHRGDSSKITFFAEPHISVGNLFVNYGLGLSLGDRPAASQGLMGPMGSNNLNVLSDNGDRYEKGFWSHFDWQLYAKYQRVQHNTLLMGMPFQDESIYTIHSEDINKNVFDIGAKIIFHYYPDYRSFNGKTRSTAVYLELIHRSKEFSYHQSHIFSSIGVTVFLLGK